MKKINVSAQFDGKPSKEEIEKIEFHIGSLLPAEFKDFLMQYHAFALDDENGAPFSFEIKGFGNTVVNYFFGVNQKNSYDILENYEALKDRVPDGCLPIADDPAGNIFLIYLPEKTIYFWDHENENFADPDIRKSRNIYEIAPDFQTFITGKLEQ